MQACNTRGLNPRFEVEAGEGNLSRRVVGIWSIALLLPTLLATGARGDYVVTDLGVIPGGNSSNGVALNLSGEVTGNGNTLTSTAQAFITTAGAGQPTDLGTLGGLTSHGAGINDSGLVIGDTAVSGGQIEAMTASGPGTMQAVSQLANWTNSYGTAINDSNQIAGYATVGGATLAWYGTVGGTPVQMSTLGGTESIATGINSSGMIVGYSTTAAGATHVFTALNGVMTDWGGLGASNTSYGMAINSGGTVVGYGGFSGSYHAFVATGPGSFTDSSTLERLGPELRARNRHGGRCRRHLLGRGGRFSCLHRAHRHDSDARPQPHAAKRRGLGVEFRERHQRPRPDRRYGNDRRADPCLPVDAGARADRFRHHRHRTGGSRLESAASAQTRTNCCPGRRRTRRRTSNTLSVARTCEAVLPVRAINSSMATG